MKKIGYLRISTYEQKPDRQIDGLRDKCNELHIETLSAVSAKRPIFDSVIENLNEGDSLVVWDLDRAFRSTIDANLTAARLKERGIHFEIVTLTIDTATPSGELVYTIMAATAQFERQNLIKRTKEGLEAARRRGVRLGRPPKLSAEQVADANYHISNNLASLIEMAKRFKVSKWTVERALEKYNLDCV